MFSLYLPFRPRAYWHGACLHLQLRARQFRRANLSVEYQPHPTWNAPAAIERLFERPKFRPGPARISVLVPTAGPRKATAGRRMPSSWFFPEVVEDFGPNSEHGGGETPPESGWKCFRPTRGSIRNWQRRLLPFSTANRPKAGMRKFQPRVLATSNRKPPLRA
jgi:hypothetical protein